MHLKRNIAACAGVVLVLVLGVMMVCGGCKASEVEWDYTGTFGNHNETTEPTQQEGNFATLSPTVTPIVTVPGTEETTVPTVEDTQPVIPPVGGGSSGGNSGSGNSGSSGTGNPVIPPVQEPTETTAPQTTDPTQATEPSESTAPDQSTEPSESTTPSESTEPSDGTESTESTESTEPALVYLTYEQFLALSGSEQYAYMQTFPSPADFNAWYADAKAAYDATIPREPISGGGNLLG